MTNKISDFTALKFPNELGTDLVPAYIHFEPQQIKYGGTRGNANNAISRPDVSNANDVFSSAAPLTSQVGVSQAYQRVGGLVDNLSNLVNNDILAAVDVLSTANIQLQNRGNRRVVSGRVHIGGNTISQGITTAPDLLNTRGSISLFLPENLSTTSAVDYTATEIGGTTNAIVQSGVQASGEDALDADQVFGSYAGGAIAELFKSGTPLSAAQSLSRGEVVNNLSFQIFNGVAHREFSYSFKMIAKDEKESQNIKLICDMFLFYMLPARTESSNDGIHFYEMPCQWQIGYYKKSNKLDFHQQPKSCFLKSVDVQYGGETGAALYTNGAPMDVTLKVDFVEIEPLYRDRELNTFNSSGGNSHSFHAGERGRT